VRGSSAIERLGVRIFEEGGSSSLSSVGGVGRGGGGRRRWRRRRMGLEHRLAMALQKLD